MSDIQPGDVVECVNARPTRQLVERGLYRVAHVLPHCASVLDDSVGVGLILHGIDARMDGAESYCADRFRKIRPADPELIALLNRERLPA